MTNNAISGMATWLIVGEVMDHQQDSGKGIGRIFKVEVGLLM